MKRLIFIQLPVLITLLSAMSFAQSGGFHGADITQTGTDYVEISGFFSGSPHDQGAPSQDGCNWYPDGPAIFTLWDHGGAPNHYGHCLWVTYVVDLTAGYWRIGLNAINRGEIKDREWYPRFEVLTEVEHVSLGPLSKKIVLIPASDGRVHHGSRWFQIPETGRYGIKFIWLNDQSECFDSGLGPVEDGDLCFDVNIMIDSVFFDKWNGWGW